MILIVVDTFLIQGRGLVVLARKTPDFADFKIGDSIEIENPDQTLVETKVKGIELINRRSFDVDSDEFANILNLIGF